MPSKKSSNSTPREPIVVGQLAADGISSKLIDKDITWTYLNYGEEDQIQIFAYRSDFVRKVMTWILYVLTLGFLRVIFHWRPNWMAQFAYIQCSLVKAEILLIKNVHHEFFIRPVKIQRSCDVLYSPPPEEDLLTYEVVNGGILPSSPSPMLRNPLGTPHHSQPISVDFGSFENSQLKSKSGSSIAVMDMPTGVNGEFESVTEFRYFTHRKSKYVWKAKTELVGGGVFQRIPSLDENVPCSYYHSCRGLTSLEAAKRRAVYGANVIAVELKPIWRLLFLEVLNPFYIFQVFSVSVWFADEYVYYAACIVVISTVSITLEVYQTRKNQKMLRDTVHSSDIVTVLRPITGSVITLNHSGEGNSLNSTGLPEYRRELVDSSALVPGDIMVIPPHGCVLQCDTVLLTGNCIVNESMLTGESVPVTKTPIPLPSDPQTDRSKLSLGVNSTQLGGEEGDDRSARRRQGSSLTTTGTAESGDQLLMYSKKEHAKHTLFCGTKVLQTRYYTGHDVKAVVIRTGFNSMKGELVRSIMYPKPVDFRFIADLLKFVGVLSIIATIGFLYTIIIMSMRGNEAASIVKRALDVITIAVPPALPAALTIGIIAARSRLKKVQIYCISPSIINTCGAIDCVCFDKTGTLTEDGLDFMAVIPVQESVFGSELGDIDASMIDNPLVQGMAACHSLTRIDNELCGDPLDLILFEATRYTLEEPRVEESAQYDQLAPTVVKPPVKRRYPSSRQSSEVAENIELNSASLHPNKDDSNFDSISERDLVAEISSPEIGIIRQFPFSSSLQRMSVITRKLGCPELNLFCKGAPEMIASLCKPHTIPMNFTAVLTRYTRKGYRVIGMGWKADLGVNFVKAQRLARDIAESELDFLGLVVLENRLKPETEPVMNILKSANIRPVMVTGDNIQTAISVARECGLISAAKNIFTIDVTEEISAEMAGLRGVGTGGSDFDLTLPTLKLTPVETQVEMEPETPRPSLTAENTEYFDVEAVTYRGDNDQMVKSFIRTSLLEPTYTFAITGSSYALLRKNYPDMVSRVAAVTSVYARMSPEQKALLVGDLQEIGYIVAMCGDGANDCGALKAAHAGISLSEAEASIASPFTSKTPNIKCVPTVIREGRAALVTSFGVFKYMAVYSLTQFLSVCLLYWIASNIGDFQFLYIDLFLITTFAIFFGYTDSYPDLVRRPPPSRILSLSSILSICLQMCLVAFFQIFQYFLITMQPWFIPFTHPGEKKNSVAYQVAGVFLQSLYQYIGMVIVYSRSKPYRKSIFNNRMLTTALVICTACSVGVTLYPPDAIANFLTLKMPPDIKYRGLILLMGVINFGGSLLIEKLVIDWFISSFMKKKGWYSEDPTPAYQKIREEIAISPDWLTNGTAESAVVSARRGRTNDSFSCEEDTDEPNEFNTHQASLNGSVENGSHRHHYVNT